MKENKDQAVIDQEAEMLEDLQAELEKMHQMIETRLWAKVELPMSFADALSRLTKDELNEIRKNFGFKNMSNLKKQDLAKELQHRIPDELQAKVKLFDQSRYELLKKLAEGNGYLYDFDLEPDQVEYFRRLGIIFSGRYDNRQILFSPKEIVEAVKKLDGSEWLTLIKRNTEQIQLTHGLLYYYGTLNLDQLEKSIEKYTDEKVALRNYIELLFDAQSYYGEIHHDYAGYSNFRVLDSEWVKEEHEARANLEYYPFSKEQILRAGEPDFMERNPQYEAFVDFLVKKCRINQEDAEYITEDMIDAFLNGEEMGELMDYLQYEIKIDDLKTAQALVDRLVKLMNNTRQWILKGYTPQELAFREQRSLRSPTQGVGDVIDFQSRKKVGRNDPCPCGSGKKFKKCCGNG